MTSEKCANCGHGRTRHPTEYGYPDKNFPDLVSCSNNKCPCKKFKPQKELKE